MKKYLFCSFLILTGLFAKGNITLPALIGDHMVLQRDKPIKIWGYGNAGEVVEVTFINKTYKTTTSTQGKWMLTLMPLKAGGPYRMIVKGENALIINDIMMGDVWLCSGQSNMEFPLSLAKNAKQEISEANYPYIRFFTVSKGINLKPVVDAKGNWSACTSNSAQYFSAIGYFFARRLQKDINVPMGLINSSWGGTVIESWISKGGLNDEPTFGVRAQQLATFDTLTYNKQHRKLYTEWLSDFNQKDKGTINGKYVWAANDLDMRDWKDIRLPTIWGFTGLNDLWEMSGIVWFKKRIRLSKKDLDSDAVLSLGFIQNADVTFINGIEIGSTPDVWGIKRSYKVPKNILKEGENIITVKVLNYGGDGGFADGDEFFYLRTSAGDQSIAGNWKYKIGYTITKFDKPEKEFGPNTEPSLMYNAMVNPLLNVSIKGVLWYQGESNWFRGYQYRELFPRMIADWREKFDQKNLPFLYVQLANYHRKLLSPASSTFLSEMREAQDMTLKVKNTGMVTAIDLGDSSNIHPKNKQEVGSRLAMLAEKQVYHLTVPADGPRYKLFTINGSYVNLTIDLAGAGLIPVTKVSGFQVAGADHQFYWAEASITGKNTIKVYSNQVPAPVAVRYAWEDNPAGANVYNSYHLPLFPFRTDNWKGITADNR